MRRRGRVSGSGGDNGDADVEETLSEPRFVKRD